MSENYDNLLFDDEPCISYQPVSQQVLSESSQAGDICEQQFGLDAMKLGYEVFMPIGHATKVDVAIRKPGFGLVSVQVKKACWQNKAYRVTLGSKGGQKSPNTDKHKQYAYGDFDVLGGYIVEADIWVFLDIGFVARGKSIYSWRPGVGKPENNWEIFEKYFT